MNNRDYNRKKIFLGAPVRDRAWILPHYIESINKQDIPMETCFIINDCNDNTEEILRQAKFNIVKRNFGKKHGHNRGEYSKGNLAKLRNLLLEEFLKSDCDYLLSVDTDIIIPDGSVKQLMADNKDIVSMLIKNSDVLNAHNIFINGKHVDEVPEGLIPVDMTGAVYLIKRSVVESGVRYAYHSLGEDIPFCDSARAKGFEVYCDTRLKPIHVFKKGLDLIAKTSDRILVENLTLSKNIEIFKALNTSQKEVDNLIQCLKRENVASATNRIQDLIDALNTMGEALEVFKNEEFYEQLERDFFIIDNSIGLVIEYLEKKKIKRALDVTTNDLDKNIKKWKDTLKTLLNSIYH